MTHSEENKLDRLYQKTMLEKYKHSSILGGTATVIHHMLSGRYASIRWYIKCAIPLTQTQHNQIHSSTHAKNLEDTIISIKGQAWHADLIKQKYKTAKYLEYEKVKAHIMGELSNYL